MTVNHMTCDDGDGMMTRTRRRVMTIPPSIPLPVIFSNVGLFSLHYYWDNCNAIVFISYISR